MLAALAAFLARAQTTPIRSLEFEGDADAAGFTILNLPDRFADDARVTSIVNFTVATNEIHGRITTATNELHGRIDFAVDELTGQITAATNRLTGQITAATNRLTGQITVATNELHALIAAVNNDLTLDFTAATNDFAGRITTVTNILTGKINALDFQANARMDMYDDRLQALVFDASPDLFTVAMKGDFATSLRVERGDIAEREGEIITGGRVWNTYSGYCDWDGSVFRNTGNGNRVAFGRFNASPPGIPTNPYAPLDAWVLYFVSGNIHYMAVGPTNDLPAYGSSGYNYAIKWQRTATGNWFDYTSTFTTPVYDYGIQFVPGTVTNLVNRRYEHVATVPEVKTVENAVNTLGMNVENTINKFKGDVKNDMDKLGAELAGIPRTLRDLAALDDRADNVKVLRERPTGGVTITGGSAAVGGPEPFGGLQWDGTAFVSGQGQIQSRLGFGKEAVVLGNFPINNLAPSDRWLFVYAVPNSQYDELRMFLGPSGDFPMEDKPPPQTYIQSWVYVNFTGEWSHGDGGGAQVYVYGKEGIETIPITQASHEPVATVGDLNKFTDIVTGAVWSLVVSNGHFIVKQEVP